MHSFQGSCYTILLSSTKNSLLFRLAHISLVLQPEAHICEVRNVCTLVLHINHIVEGLPIGPLQYNIGNFTKKGGVHSAFNSSCFIQVKIKVANNCSPVWITEIPKRPQPFTDVPTILNNLISNCTTMEGEGTSIHVICPGLQQISLLPENTVKP